MGQIGRTGGPPTRAVVGKIGYCRRPGGDAGGVLAKGVNAMGSLKKHVVACAVGVVLTGAILLTGPPGSERTAQAAQQPPKRFTVQLTGSPPQGAQVYTVIILGGGTNGKDHWGWPNKSPVLGPRGPIQRGNRGSWAPIGPNGSFTFSLQASRSSFYAGVVRWLHGKQHGASSFGVYASQGR